MKLSTILSQTDEGDVSVLTEGELEKCYARYEVVFGANVTSPEGKECSVEQLSGLRMIPLAGGAKSPTILGHAGWSEIWFLLDKFCVCLFLVCCGTTRLLLLFLVRL